jgi:hypothetical protein
MTDFVLVTPMKIGVSAETPTMVTPASQHLLRHPLGQNRFEAIEARSA